MKIDDHTVDISNTDKVFFPESGITKQDLIDYYEDVSALIVPFLKNRPVMIQRFPNGIDEQGFYQKAVSDYFPNWLGHIHVKKKDGEIEHIVCNDKAALIYYVNQGTITFHNWLSTTDNLNNPDQLVIDLDPPEGNFEIVRQGALILNKLLDEMKISSFVQTTGSEGLHVFVPLDGKASYDVVRSVVKSLGNYMCDQEPDVFTTAQRIENRDGKLFFDVHAMAYGQTNVTPYSVRPLPNAPIATPLDWEELKKPELGPDTYHLKNIRMRLAKKENPWKDWRERAISINQLKKKL
ncbi:MAG: ATP-dependent DNA ligase [Crocinitomicaceae bacterium]|nr:ATP-dependent DNA ligase [Crocinitomicaceae bacterium]